MKAGLKAAWPWLASALSGVLLALCYPGWNLSGLVWVWQIPLFAALWFSGPTDGEAPRWRRGLALGYVAGLAFFLVNLSWLFELRLVVGSAAVGLAAWVALPAYLAVYFAAWGAFAATVARWTPQPAAEEKGLFQPSLRVMRAAALAAAAWCGLEWMRGILFTGFGWNGLGVALHDNLYLIQAAETVGVTGLAFVVVFCNATWTATLVRLWRELAARQRPRPHLDFAAAVALMAGLFLHGLAVVAGREQPGEEDVVSLRALVVQLNTPLEEKWDMANAGRVVDEYRALTLAYVEAAEFDLVLWPETALPGRWTFPWVQEFLDEEILPAGDFTLVMGIEDEDLGTGDIFNSVALARGRAGEAQLHRKLHLVPFGEYLPLRNSFPVFRWIAGGMVPMDFSAGDSHEPLRLEKPEAGIIPLVCFEDTVGRLARKFVRPGPQLLVNVTNDGWFHESAAAAQHLANAKFRCVELRRPMARAANTGVSGFIDELGSLEFPGADPGGPRHLRLRVVQDPLTGNTFTTGTLPATVTLDRSPPLTFYARHGDAFSVAAGLAALAAAAALAARRRVRR